MCNSWPLPVQPGRLLYSVSSKCTNFCLYLCDHKESGACEVYRVESGAVLYCISSDSAVCFTFDRMLRGPRKYLDKGGKRISALHQDRNPFIV